MPIVARWLGDRPQYMDENGAPLASGLLFSYVAGTSTKAPTYTTSGGDVQNANPMVLDAAGRPEQMIFLDASVVYDMKLCDPGSSDPPSDSIWTEEDIVSIDPTGTTSFADDEFVITGSGDDTKKVAFEVDGITVGQTRTISVPDYSLRIGNLPAGMVMDYAGPTAPAGWLECDGSAISRTTYAALFAAIGVSWGEGNTTTTFNLPPSSDRVRKGRGSGTITESVTQAAVSTGADSVTVVSNLDKWITGQQITWGVTGTPPTTNPANLLDNGDTVYVVRINATTVKFATSLANAQIGTIIDITAAGSGTFTMTRTLAVRVIGETGGEDTHAMTITEMLAHAHGIDVNGSGSSSTLATGASLSPSGISTAAAGGNAAMNITSPYAVYMTVISI